MKHIYLSLIVLIFTITAFAQVPNKMSYQAVIRNTSNNLVINQTVGMRISILQNSPTGTSVYTETQTATTNTNGLISLEIGGGTVVSGNFSTIDWGNGSYYIKTETDPTGGTAYSITGASQLLSVPYALYSKTSGMVNNQLRAGEIILPTCVGYCYPTVLNVVFSSPLPNDNYSVSVIKETTINSSGNDNNYGTISILNKTPNGFSIRIEFINFTYPQNKKIYWSTIMYQ
jgi:hypothetical protein